MCIFFHKWEYYNRINAKTNNGRYSKWIFNNRRCKRCDKVQFDNSYFYYTSYGSVCFKEIWVTVNENSRYAMIIEHRKIK